MRHHAPPHAVLLLCRLARFGSEAAYLASRRVIHPPRYPTSTVSYPSEAAYLGLRRVIHPPRYPTLRRVILWRPVISPRGRTSTLPDIPPPAKCKERAECKERHEGDLVDRRVRVDVVVGALEVDVLPRAQITRLLSITHHRGGISGRVDVLPRGEITGLRRITRLMVGYLGGWITRLEAR